MKTMNQVDHHVMFLMNQQLFYQNILFDFTWKKMTKDKFFLQDESQHMSMVIYCNTSMKNY